MDIPDIPDPPELPEPGQASERAGDTSDQADSTRVVRSVHPDLVKYGYYTRDGTYRGTPMTFAELKQLAASWNQGQKRVDPDTATREIVVLDVLDQTASAKIVAHWGIDYMHLAKVDGRWMVRQILWQSHPSSR